MAPQLTHRFYDSAGERLLVFAHGSSYHGGYHALAWAISRSGTTKVVLPICADIICLGGVAATSILSGNSRTISSTSSVSFTAQAAKALGLTFRSHYSVALTR